MMVVLVIQFCLDSSLGPHRLCPSALFMEFLQVKNTGSGLPLSSLSIFLIQIGTWVSVLQADSYICHCVLSPAPPTSWIVYK